MRLRRSNKGKRFRPSDLNLQLGLSDDDAEGISQGNNESHDDGFVDDGESEPDVEDEVDENLDESSGIESPAKEARKPKPKPRPKPKSKKSDHQPAPDPAPVQSLGVVQEYPTDITAKWTRSYAGPVKRWTRLQLLTKFWFGDRENYLAIVGDFVRLWWEYQMLPPKLVSRHDLRLTANPWMPVGFSEDQKVKFRQWYERYLAKRTHASMSSLIDKSKAFRWFIPQAAGDLTVTIGDFANQKEHRFKQGRAMSFSGLGNLIEEMDSGRTRSSGWLFDVGGIVMSMGWAPSDSQADQLLAMTVVPFADQAFYQDLKKAPRESDKKEGAIQIWRFEADEDGRGLVRPAQRPPTLIHTLCFSWGRASRLQWCPVPLTSHNKIGLLAVLCGDGKLRVLEVSNTARTSKGTFEEMQDSVATIGPPREHTVKISCFTWVNMNRVAVGHTDGTIALWSIYPCQILQRHPVHLSPIIDIASGYPSHPFVIATIPMGGVFILIDLNRPNQEMSYNPNLSVCVQPNLLSWSEILRGYVLIWPSAFAGNSALAFEHVKVFAQGRYIMTLDSQPTCLSIGRCHPCLLAGTTDGSLWVVNIMKKAYSHREASSKLRLFRHEYRAANPAGAQDDNNEGGETRRGRCRILHGFLPERNTHPKATKLAQQKAGAKPSKSNSSSNSKTKTKNKGKGRAKKGAPDDGSDEEPDDEDDDDLSDAMGELNAEGEGPGAVPQPIVVHDPQTRITHVAWNPNARFSWWAAAAMGSGLVRVMDLGVDQPRARGGASSASDDESSEEDEEEEEEDDDDDGDDDENAKSDDEMDDEDEDVVVTRRSRTRRSGWTSVN